jgi:hypothetical protein
MRALTAVASAKAGVRVQRSLQICLGCRSIPTAIGSKNRDKQLTHIVRVICRICFKTVKMYECWVYKSLLKQLDTLIIKLANVPEYS